MQTWISHLICWTSRIKQKHEKKLMKNSFSVLISVHLLKCSLSRHNGIIAPNTKFFFFFLLGFLRVLKLVQHKTKVPSPRLQRKTHQKRRIWCLASTKDNINMETKFPHTLISFYRLWEKGSYPKWLFCIRSLSIPSPQLYFFWVFIHAFNSSDEWNWSIVFAWK